jgi:single-strand DNA-binding protein
MKTMSGYLNRVQLIGNVGQDPEVRMSQTGKKIVTLSIATGESWRDPKSGERVQRTEWHRVVIFNEGLADIAEKYLRKGAKILAEGKLATRKWTDKEVIERYSTEVQIQAFNGQLTFLDNKNEGGSAPRRASRDPAPALAGAHASDLDDEIPF